MLICSSHATVNIPWPYQTKFLCRLCVSPIFFACNAFKGAHKSWIMDINDIRTPSPFIQLHYHLPDDSAYIYTNCVNMCFYLSILWEVVFDVFHCCGCWESSNKYLLCPGDHLQDKKRQTYRSKNLKRRLLLGLSIKRGKINRTFSDISMIISSDNLISIHLFLYFSFPHQHRECNRLGSYFLCAISLTEFYYVQVLCKGATLGLCHMKNQVLSTMQVENLTWKCCVFIEISLANQMQQQQKNLINKVVQLNFCTLNLQMQGIPDKTNILNMLDKMSQVTSLTHIFI